MFFDLVLLNKQHKSGFGFAWIAATRGAQHIPKKVILELDIPKLCDDIIEYVNSDSDSPRSRFSLRLSAFLINGTMKIYRQKAIFFLDDVVEVLSAVSRPYFFDEEIRGKRGPAIFDIPSTPIARRKSKKKPVSSEKSTPLSELENLVAAIKAQESGLLALPGPETDILRARIGDVTMRETLIQPQEEDRGADFGDLGIFQLSDVAEMLQVIAPPAKELFPPVSEKISELQPQESRQEIVLPYLEDILPPKTRRQLTESTSSSSEPQPVSTKLTVQAQIHVPSEVEVQQEPQHRETIVQPREDLISEVQVEPTIPTETSVPERRVLREVQLESLEEREVTTEMTKKEPKDDFKIQLKKRAFKFARIDRPKVVKKNDYPEPLFEVKMKVLRITNLLNTYMVKSDRITETVRKISGETTPRDSLPFPRRSLRETPPVEVSTQERVVPAILEQQVEEMPIHETPQIPTEGYLAVPQPLLTSTPVAPHLEIEKTVEEVMAVAGEEQFVSPRKKRRLLDKEEIPTAKDLAFITLPTEIQARELTGSVLTLQQETVESVSIPVITEQNRQQDIVNKILVDRRLTLEELCQKPINKLNIARAFNDVLVLCKHGYVTLTSEEDSSELKFIEKGPKMYR